MRSLFLLVFVTCVVILTGCAPSTVAENPPGVLVAGDSPSGGLTELDTYSLISLAVAEGEIGYSTGLLYKVYAVYDPLSLPSEYRSEAPIKCGAPLVDEVQRNWGRLTPADKAEISQYIKPIGERDFGGTQLDDVTPDQLERERTAID